MAQTAIYITPTNDVDLEETGLHLSAAQNGVWYMVHPEDVVVPTIPKVCVSKIDHGLTTITEGLDSTHAPQCNDLDSGWGGASCIDLANHVLHVVYCGPSTGYNCRYIKFYMAGHASPETYESAYTTISSQACNAGDMKICVDPNGKVHILFGYLTTSMGSSFRGMYYTNNVADGGNTFKTPFLVLGGASYGYHVDAKGLQCDSAGVPHLHLLDSNGTQYKVGYGDTNNATSFTLGNLSANKLGDLYLDSNDKMVLCSHTSNTSLTMYTESTFPSFTSSTTTGTPVPSSQPRMTFYGTTGYVFFRGNTSPYVNHLMMRKWTASGGWGSAIEICLDEDTVVPTIVFPLRWDVRVALPDAVGCTFGFYYDGSWLTSYPMATIIANPVAAAGCEASGHVYSPPLLISPADALAGCEASCVVTTDGPQVAEPAPADASAVASVIVFQSSVTQTPDLAAAGTYAFAILQSDNHEIPVESPAEAQAWAAISAILVGTDIFATPAPARARGVIGPDFEAIYDERPFNQGFLMMAGLRVQSGTGLTGEAGSWEMSLRPLEAWGFLDVNVLLAASAILPRLRVASVGVHGALGGGALTLRPLEASAGNTERVGEGHVYLWRPEAAGTGLTGRAGAGAATLESLRLNAYGPGMGGEMSGAAVLPAMGVLHGTVASGFNFNGQLLLPALLLHGADERTLELSGAATFPALLASGTGGEAATGWAVLRLAALTLTGIAEYDVSENIAARLLGVVVYAMHTKVGAVTDFENFQFNSYAHRGHTYLAATPEGIFDLQGDADDGVAIDAELRKLDVDLASFHHKRVTDAYLHLHASGPFRVLAFANGVPAESLVVNGSGLHAHKVNLARGLTGSQLGFGYANEEGSDFLLDQIDYLVEVTSRRHG
jgi:hypothetical protein